MFYSSIICEREGVEEIVDARTSDAIALALRFKAPIFTHKDILDSAGIFLKTGGKKEEDQELEDVILDDFLQSDDPQASTKVDFDKMSNKQIKNAIEVAVKNEDYELAAELRDKLTKKNE